MQASPKPKSSSTTRRPHYVCFPFICGGNSEKRTSNKREGGAEWEKKEQKKEEKKKYLKEWESFVSSPGWAGTSTSATMKKKEKKAWAIIQKLKEEESHNDKRVQDRGERERNSQDRIGIILQQLLSPYQRVSPIRNGTFVCLFIWLPGSLMWILIKITYTLGCKRDRERERKKE